MACPAPTKKARCNRDTAWLVWQRAGYESRPEIAAAIVAALARQRHVPAWQQDRGRRFPCFRDYLENRRWEENPTPSPSPEEAAEATHGDSGSPAPDSRPEHGAPSNGRAEPWGDPDDPFAAEPPGDPATEEQEGGGPADFGDGWDVSDADGATDDAADQETPGDWPLAPLASPPPAPDPEPSGFRAFIAAYPVGRKAYGWDRTRAREEWDRAGLEADEAAQAAILADLARLRRLPEYARRNWETAPGPADYLRARSWEAPAPNPAEQPGGAADARQPGVAPDIEAIPTPPASPRHVRRITDLAADLGLSDAGLGRLLAQETGRDVTRPEELTSGEAQAVIAYLREEAAMGTRRRGSVVTVAEMGDCIDRIFDDPAWAARLAAVAD